MNITMQHGRGTRHYELVGVEVDRQMTLIGSLDQKNIHIYIHLRLDRSGSREVIKVEMSWQELIELANGLADYLAINPNQETNKQS